MMQCSKCRSEAVIFQPYSGQHLCKDHFIIDFEAKAKRTIRRYQWLRPGDHIGVVQAGGVEENTLLFFLRKLTGKRRDIQVSAIYDHEICSDLTAGDLPQNFTRIALATSLETTASSALTALLRGIPRLMTSTAQACPFTTITPFCHIPTSEIITYAYINTIPGDGVPQEASGDPLADDVQMLLEEYSRHHPATPFAIVNLQESLERHGTVAGNLRATEHLKKNPH